MLNVDFLLSLDILKLLKTQFLRKNRYDELFLNFFKKLESIL